MDYSNLVYGLLQSLAWSITPALPLGSAGTRLPVGIPEHIPDFTFYTRRVTPADGVTSLDPTVTPQQECDRLNRYIDGAVAYHTLFGLDRKEVSSFEDVLDHFKASTTPIGRIRFISHGNAAFIWCPIFSGGWWDFGMQTGFLQALKDKDENGLRFLFVNTVRSTLFDDIVDPIVTAVRASNSALLAPFGLASSGSPVPALRPYFEILSDLYQARHGTMTITHDTGPKTAPSTAQDTIISGALNLIEASVRADVAAAGGATDPDMTAFRDALLALAPAPLGMFEQRIDLPTGTIVAVAAATPTPVETTLRAAFTGGTQNEPVFDVDVLSELVTGLEMFNRAPLNIGPTPPLTVGDISMNADLNSLVLIGVDLFLLQNGAVFENGTALTTTQRNTLRQGLFALASFPRGRLSGGSSPPFTGTQLDTLRDAMANLSYKKSTILGVQEVAEDSLLDLQKATASMRLGFRTRLDHFRGLMQPADASSFDVRGCLVGQSTSFLDTLREFLGTASNRPVVTAPDWFQSFSTGFWRDFQTSIAPSIDALQTNGIVAGAVTVIDATDVGTWFATWRGFIDFDPHFDFMAARFATTASKRDFASLSWRVFRMPAALQGIPVLRMQANRIDDFDTLTLSRVIERFRDIFEIPTASVPDTTTRTKLNSLQPHIVRFKTISDAIDATASPTSTQLAQFITDLTNLVMGISAVGLTGATAPTAPAGSTLVDVQGYVTAVGAYLDGLLEHALNAFFTAIEGVLGGNHPDPRMLYFYNCGLPLLLRNETTQSTFRVSSFVSPGGTAGSTLIGHALRSWMRIQWQGTPAQAAAINTRIESVIITNDPQREAASRVPLLAQNETANSPTAIAPLPEFAAHIVKRPP